MDFLKLDFTTPEGSQVTQVVLNVVGRYGDVAAPACIYLGRSGYGPQKYLNVLKPSGFKYIDGVGKVEAFTNERKVARRPRSFYVDFTKPVRGVHSRTVYSAPDEVQKLVLDGLIKPSDVRLFEKGSGSYDRRPPKKIERNSVEMVPVPPVISNIQPKRFVVLGRNSIQYARSLPCGFARAPMSGISYSQILRDESVATCETGFDTVTSVLRKLLGMILPNNIANNWKFSVDLFGIGGIVENSALVDALKALLASAGGILDTIKGVIVELQKHIMFLVVIGGLILVLRQLPGESFLRNVISSVLSLIMLPTVATMVVKNYLMPTVAETQSFGSFKPFVLVASVMQAAYGWDLSYWTENVMPVLNKFKDETLKAEKIEAQVMEMWTMSTTFVNDMLSAVGLPQLFMSSGMIHEWSQAVWKFRMSVETRAVPMNRATADQYHLLMKKGLRLLKEYGKQKSLGDIISRNLNILSNMYVMLGAAFDSIANHRPEPFTLMLQGPPGCGKSWLLEFIHMQVYLRHHTIEQVVELNGDIRSEMYVPDGGNFEEGYCHQFTYCMDDFGQKVVDLAQENSEYFKVVRMVNPVKFNMPMAFGDKGKMFFNSKLLLLSVNRLNIETEVRKVLTYPKALTRRIASYRVVLDPEYVNKDTGVIDKDKAAIETQRIMREDPHGCPNFWLFVRYDPLTGQDIDGFPVLNLSQIIRMSSEGVKKAIEDYERSHVSEIDYFANWYGKDPKIFGPKETMLSKASGVVKNLWSKVAKTESGDGDEIQPLDKEYGCWHDAFSGPCDAPDVEDEQLDYTPSSEQAYGAWYNTFSTINEFDASVFKMHVDKKLKGPRADMSRWMDSYVDDIKSGWKSFIDYVLGEHKWCIIPLISTVVVTALTFILPVVWKMLKTAFNFTKKQAVVNAKGICDTVFRQRHKYLKLFEKDDVVEDEPIQTLLNAAARLESGFSFADGGREFPEYPQGVNDVIKQVQGNVVLFLGKQRKLGLNAPLRRIGTGLMLCNQCIQYPNHFDADFRECSEVHVYRVIPQKNKPRMVTHMNEFEIQNFLDYPSRRIDGNDIRIRNVPWSGFVDVCGKIPCEKDVMSERDPVAKIVIIKWDFFLEESMVSRTVSYVSGVCQNKVAYGNKANPDWAHRVVRYSSVYTSGDCGALIFRMDGKSPLHLIGNHFAGIVEGGKNLGFGSLFSREQILKAADAVLGKIGVTQGADFTGVLVESGLDAPIDADSFSPIGEIDPEYGPQVLPTVSKLKKTQLQKIELFGPPTRAPAKLKLHTEPNPMVKALGKYANRLKCLPRRKLDWAVDEAMADFFLFSEKERFVACRRTFEEAVTGVVGGVRIVAPINRGSSPGFPYNTSARGRKHATKRFFLGDDEWDFESPQAQALKYECLNIINKANDGVRSPTLFTDFLKDELRSHDRVREGKTRLISGGPLAYTIACRMLFMDFIGAFETYRSPRVGSESIVGINPYKEYDPLFRRMSMQGENWFAGDFSAFDGSEQPDVHNAIFSLINRWYYCDEVNNRARLVLLLELTNSYHIGGLSDIRKGVYMWHMSLPSGHPMTTLINTMYNMTVFRYVWHELCPHLKWNQHVAAAFYGDDNLFCVSDEAIELFNVETVTPVLETLGLTYTDDSKAQGGAKSKTWQEITILKRRFNEVESDGKKYIVGALDMTSIKEMVYWYKSSSKEGSFEPECEAIKQDINIFLMEMSLHGEKVFCEYVPKLDEALKKCYNMDLGRSFQSYQALYESVLAQTLNADYKWAT